MPDQMTPSEARVVDPVLTEHAHSYEHPQMIWSGLFPRVPVAQRGVAVIKFDRRSFLLYNSGRAPGGSTKRVQIGYTDDPVQLFDHSLEGKVPFELMQEAQEGPGIDLEREAVDEVLDMLNLRLEYDAGQVARDPNNYDADHKETLASGDKWSDPTSPDPAIVVNDAGQAIRRSIGRRPNTLVLSGAAFDALTEHEEIQDQFKYTSTRSITADMLAAYFFGSQSDGDQVRGQVLVGDAVYAESDDQDAQMVDVWGKDAILAYVPMRENMSRRRPSYGYTYMLRDHPFAEEGYRDRNEKSWIYPLTMTRSPELTSMDAGYLMQDVVA